MHFGTPGTGVPLKPGMIFTIEPMINLGPPACEDSLRRLDRGHPRPDALEPVRAFDRHYRDRLRDLHPFAGRPVQPHGGAGWLMAERPDELAEAPFPAFAPGSRRPCRPPPAACAERFPQGRRRRAGRLRTARTGFAARHSAQGYQGTGQDAFARIRFHFRASSTPAQARLEKIEGLGATIGPPISR